jgi:hypothetical protein
MIANNVLPRAFPRRLAAHGGFRAPGSVLFFVRRL